MKQKTLFENNIGSKIAYYESRNNYCGKYLMFDIIYGGNVKIDSFMYHLIKYFVKDNYKSLVDPTCGLENHSFSDILDILNLWGIEYKPCDKNPENWACKNGFSNCVCDVFDKNTLPEGEVWFYDPPFIPYEALNHGRKEDYAMSGVPIDEIKRFYSQEVFNNFIEKGAKMIIVKGSSFYYPKDSENFYLFEKDIVMPTDKMKLIARIIYRYYNQYITLNNARMGKYRERGIYRLQNVSSTFMIFRVV